jgi:hypothetical protein
MFDHTHDLRRLAGVAAVVATAVIAAPIASGDPPTVPAPIPQVAAARLGEQLSGRDRAWLISSQQSAAPRLGERLSGTDRSWLTSDVGESPVAQPSNGFDWGDAGIGAGTAAVAVVVTAGSALLIRRRISPAH